MKDDGARGAEITVEDGELPYCPDCQVKHAADLVAHIDPAEKEKYEKAAWLFDTVSKQVGMTKMQEQDYAQIRELEHKFEDGLTVLRDLRHKVQVSPAIDNPAEKHVGENPSPQYHKVLSRCINKVEHKCCDGHSTIVYDGVGHANYSKCSCNPFAVCKASIKTNPHPRLSKEEFAKQMELFRETAETKHPKVTYHATEYAPREASRM
jgi:hypothetical protein